MKSALFVTCTVALAASPLACNPFAPSQAVILSATTIDAPTTVTPGATFPVTLTVQTGGCLSFVRIDVRSNTTGVTLIPWGMDATVGHKDVACPSIVRYESHAVQLKAGTSDPYSVDVDQGRLAPLHATVRVQ
jgi:hypothetical protein